MILKSSFFIVFGVPVSSVHRQRVNILILLIYHLRFWVCSGLISLLFSQEGWLSLYFHLCIYCFKTGLEIILSPTLNLR